MINQKINEKIAIFRNLSKEHRKDRSRLAGFSLAEAMITLLMVSIILAAIAPIMSKKIKLTQTGFSTDGGYKYREILDTVGAGTWAPPSGLQEVAVTVLGAGGGGGAGLSQGEVEWKTPGTYTWTVPNGVTEIEATLVSGGAGGGAGNIRSVSESFTSGASTGVWTVPTPVKGANLLLSLVGGGGAGGGGSNVANAYNWVITGGAGGGSGGLLLNQVVSIPANQATINYNRGLGGSAGQNSGGQGSDGAAAGIAGSCAQSSQKDGAAGAGANGGPRGDGTIGFFPAGYGYSYSGNGGDGGTLEGGGGGGASRFGPLTNSNLFWAGGGGGGGGGLLFWNYGLNSSGQSCYHGQATNGGWSGELPGGGGGGGGGQIGGGRGGYGAKATTNCSDWFAPQGGFGGTPGGINGAGIPPWNWNVFPSGGGGGSERCVGSTCLGAGGTGGRSCNGCPTSTIGTNGSDGGVWLTYLLESNGGSGGGGGGIVAAQKVKVTPGETLTVYVGSGQPGGTAGYIKSDGTIVQPTDGQHVSGRYDDAISSRRPSYLMRGTSYILSAGHNLAVGGGNYVLAGRYIGTCSLDSALPSFGCRTAGAGNGVSSSNVNGEWKQMQSTWGKSAGNLYGDQPGPFANGTVGGDGGITAIDDAGVNINGTGTATHSDYSKLPSGWCKTTKGGTASNPDGQSASGFGGCGGAGGYGLGAGGNGAGGYARIRWNQVKQGAGGGGGSSNIVYRTIIRLANASPISYFIGDGGLGGGTSYNTSTHKFSNGGVGSTTWFNGNATARIQVLGGKGGTSAFSTTTGTTGDTVNTVYTSGTGGLNIIGGAPDNGCFFGASIVLCYGSAAGANATATVGGNGAGLEYKGVVYGTGGGGSSTGTGNAGDKYGSGGGGGGIGNNSNGVGGKGAPAQIILEWK